MAGGWSLPLLRYFYVRGRGSRTVVELLRVNWSVFSGFCFVRCVSTWPVPLFRREVVRLFFGVRSCFLRSPFETFVKCNDRQVCHFGEWVVAHVVRANEDNFYNVSLSPYVPTRSPTCFRSKDGVQLRDGVVGARVT